MSRRPRAPLPPRVDCEKCRLPPTLGPGRFRLTESHGVVRMEQTFILGVRRVDVVAVREQAGVGHVVLVLERVHCLPVDFLRSQRGVGPEH